MWFMCMLVGMKTEVVILDGGSGDAEKIGVAGGVIDSGGLVAFPTETVYGIGCAAKSSAIGRLDVIKSRGSEKRYTLHISDKSELEKYVPNVTSRAKRLIGKGWPGPLTVVFEVDDKAMAYQRSVLDDDTFAILYSDSTIGVRCPDNPVAIELLAAVSVPVVAPSANLPGMPPAVDTDGVMAQLDGKIDMVLSADGKMGRCKYNTNSTVVKVTTDRIEVLREGVYSSEQIREMAMTRILFVCTGNTCRSPMAEGLCRKYISEKLNCALDELENKGYKIASAGVMAVDGFGASSESVEVCHRRGVDISGHRSMFLASSEVAKSDYIFVMSESHRQRVLEICPSAAEKCVKLAGKVDIADPIGGSLDVYKACGKQIYKALTEKIDEILI